MVFPSKRVKKFLEEAFFLFCILSGLVGLFYFLWFFDVHTLEITVTRGPH